MLNRVGATAKAVTTQWTALGGGSVTKGTENLRNWSDARYAMVNSDAGEGDSQSFPLTRALKATDVILITWRKSRASSADCEMAGQSIFHPGAYSYDVALELVEEFQDNSNYYGLFLSQSTTEVPSASLDIHAVSYGANTYGPAYLITGVYNISGI